MVDLRIIIMAPAIIGIMIVMFSSLGVIMDVAFPLIDSSGVVYGNLIKIGMGLTALVLILGIIYYTVKGTQDPVVPPRADF